VSADDEPRKRAPILVGHDFGDDDEATQLDLSAAGLRSLSSSPAPAPSEPIVTEVLLERPRIDDKHDDIREEKSGSRVVPLAEDSRRLIGTRSGPMAVLGGEGIDDEADDETVQLTRPAFAGGRALPPPPKAPALVDDETGPLVRPLDAVHIDIGKDVSNDRTLSRPKIHRMTFSPRDDVAKGGTDTRKRAATGSPPPDLEDEEPPGRLVIAAPDDATVFVDGTARGTGTVTLDEVHRHRRLAVRVHRPGCRPWSRAVSLGGRDELRITATPEPR